MDKELGQEYKNPIQREAFLKDNCDGCEQKGYMKPYSPEELQGHKEKLANVSIEIEELENEKKEAMEIFKGKLKPLPGTAQTDGFQYQGKGGICDRNMLQVHRPRNKGNRVLQQGRQIG